MKKKTISGLLLLLLSSLVFTAVFASPVRADTYGYTMVLFYVPVDTSFSIKILGQSAYNITAKIADGNKTAAWISFNATSADQKWVHPQTLGSVTNRQADGGNSTNKPIFFFANTGSVYINISLAWKQGSTPNGCIDMCANTTCWRQGGCRGSVFVTACTNITSTESELIGNLSYKAAEGIRANMTLYANFTSCILALDTRGQLNYHSERST